MFKHFSQRRMLPSRILPRYMVIKFVVLAHTPRIINTIASKCDNIWSTSLNNMIQRSTDGSMLICSALSDNDLALLLWRDCYNRASLCHANVAIVTYILRNSTGKKRTVFAYRISTLQIEISAVSVFLEANHHSIITHTITLDKKTLK